MSRIKLLIPLLLLTTLVYSQTSTLFQNIDIRAKELKHSLNKTGDSLLLHSERKIHSVNIFNVNGKETYEIGGNKTELPLNHLSVGRYVVEIVLIDKRIILTLLRNEPLHYDYEIIMPKIHNIALAKSEILPIEENKIIEDIEIEKSKNYNATDETDVGKLLNIKTNKHPSKKETTDERLSRIDTPEDSKYHYWIVLEVNSGSYSNKTMKMASLKDAERLIEKNQLDIKTLKGQSNLLTVWEIYDNSKFSRQNYLNPDFLETKSECFNPIPYYKTATFGD